MPDNPTGNAPPDEQDRLACLAALASPVTHELNNFLNLVLLQIAVLQHHLPEEFREELAAIRRQGKGLAALVQQWQHYRQRCQPPTAAVDLNAIIGREAERLGGLCPEGVGLRQELTPGLPAVFGTEPELRLLLRFLVTNAAAALKGAGGALTIRTARDQDAVLLTVEDTGPAPSGDKMAQLFDPQEPARPGTNGLELAACETLVRRRFQGRIEPAALPEQGLAIRIRLKIWNQSGVSRD